MFNSAIKKITLCSLATAAMAIGTGSYAHTGVKDSKIEGKTLYTAFSITHGCNNNDGTEKLLPVTAQSAVFPNATDSQAFKIDPTTSAETAISIFDEIEDPDNLQYLNLGPGMVQDKNVFKKQKEVTDATGKVRAIVLTKGKLDTTAVGLIPFRVGGITFKQASCAKNLLVRIAVGNFCSKSKNVNKNNRVDIWIGHPTPLFSDGDVLPHDWETDPFWPTLTVERDLDSNPLDSGCGEGYDIAIQPSDADIDAYLPINGYWPK